MIHDTIILKNHDIKKSASPLLSKGSIQKNQILKRRYFVKSNYVAEHQEHLLSAHHSADPDDNDAAHGQLFDRSKCNVTTMNHLPRKRRIQMALGCHIEHWRMHIVHPEHGSEDTKN